MPAEEHGGRYFHFQHPHGHWAAHARFCVDVATQKEPGYSRSPTILSASIFSRMLIRLSILSTCDNHQSHISSQLH